jgi:hypothetical protein
MLVEFECAPVEQQKAQRDGSDPVTQVAGSKATPAVLV